jgi:hypothetical protein
VHEAVELERLFIAHFWCVGLFTDDMLMKEKIWNIVLQKDSVLLSPSLVKRFFFLEQKSSRLYICFHIAISSLKVSHVVMGSVGHLLQLVFSVGPKTAGGRLCCSYRAGGGDCFTASN